MPGAAPIRADRAVEVVERLGLDPGHDLVDERARQDRLGGDHARGPVLRTEARTVSMSSGTRLRRSITST